MSKMVRVEIETDDGRVAVLTGEAAELYQRQIEHASSMACVHGSRFEALPWAERDVVATAVAPTEGEIAFADRKAIIEAASLMAHTVTLCGATTVTVGFVAYRNLMQAIVAAEAHERTMYQVDKPG